MARNLVREENEELKETPTENKEALVSVQVNQVEALIINRIDNLTAIVLEMAKQVGVKFDESTEKKH